MGRTEVPGKRRRLLHEYDPPEEEDEEVVARPVVPEAGPRGSGPSVSFTPIHPHLSVRFIHPHSPHSPPQLYNPPPSSLDTASSLSPHQ